MVPKVRTDGRELGSCCKQAASTQSNPAASWETRVEQYWPSPATQCLHGSWWTGGIRSPDITSFCSPDTHMRSRSSGLGPQRNFRYQILVSSPNITVKRPFTNHSWGPKFWNRLLKISTTICPDAYWPFVGCLEIWGFGCTELSHLGPGQQRTAANTKVLKKRATRWDRFLGECRTLTVKLYQYFTAI